MNKKEPRKTNYNSQEQQWQHKSNKNLKIDLGRKQLYGYFKQQTGLIVHKMTWTMENQEAHSKCPQEQSQL